MLFRLVKIQGRVKSLSCCVERPPCHPGVADLIIANPHLIALLFKGSSIAFYSADSYHRIVTRKFNFLAVFFSNDSSIFNSCYFHLCYKSDPFLIYAFSHADLTCRAHVGAELFHHLKNGYFRSFAGKVLCCFHTHHSAADHNDISVYTHVSVKHIVGIHDKIFILSGNIGDDWYSSYGIDYRMRIYFFYKFRSNRCIHADIHAKAFRLFRHCHNGVFHFLFSGSFTCRQELPSQLICAFTEYRAVASLFQDDRGLKSADPPACYKDRLRLICLNDLTFSFSSQGWVP